MNYSVLQGDCREVMASMEANTVDSVVCDPPYGLSFMGKGWDHSVPGVEFWAEALRVAKPGSHLLAFGGTRLFHRLACAIEDAGWEIRDTIMWCYGSGFPKSRNGEWGGTALKPAWEPIIVARKPLDGTVAHNFKRWGVGGLNIDGCRVSSGEENPSIARREAARKSGKCGTDMHSANRVKKGLPEFNKDVDRFIQGNPGERLGRWPANLIHDGSDEVVVGFPACKTGAGGVTKQNAGANTWGSHKSRETIGYADSGSAARFFYCAKASKRDRDEGCEGLEERKAGAMSGVETREGKPTNHPIRTNFHPTVKPTDLMAYLCRLVTPPRGIVLDPFCGSGSTGKAAMREGFDFIGIERDPDYCKIAEARIQAELDKRPLYAEATP